MLKKLKFADFIIIILIITALAIGSAAVLKKKSFANLPVEKESKIMFDVFFRGVTITAPEMPFKAGDDAFITIRNVPYKKLKINAIDGSPRLKYISAKNDKGYLIAEDISMPALYDIVIRLEADAKKTPDGWVSGGNKIKAGIPAVIEGDLYRYQGVISNIFEAPSEQTAEEETKEQPQE